MGDFTPEALEVQCPGCKSRFRIKLKSENLDNTTVSCPKCFADIPVESNRLPAGSSPSPDLSQVDVAFSRVETRRSAAFPPDKTPSTTIRSLNAPTLGDDEQDAVNRLERLSLGTFTEPDTIRATFSGFPGRTSDNPFHREKTATSTRSPLLQEFIDLDNDAMSAGQSDPSSISDVHSEATMERDVPNLVRKKRNDASEALTGKSHSSENQDEHLRQTSELDAVSAAIISRPTAASLQNEEKVDENKQSQIISKLRARLPLDQSGKPESTKEKPEPQDEHITESSSDDNYDNSPDGTTGILKADAIPEEYRDWHDFPSEQAPALATDSPLDIASSQANSNAPSSDSSVDAEAEPTLAKLFKRAQKRRASLNNEVITRAPLPERQKTTTSGPSISVDITEDEVASILDSSTELSQSKIFVGESTRPKLATPKLPKASPPVLPPALSPTKDHAQSDTKTAPPYSLKNKLAVTEHSGIHDGLFADVPRAAEKPPHPITHDSIVIRPDRSGKTTSQSMLARLRQRRESMEIDAAIASESRGSGFIRLPTAEIQQVLGRGSYRLLIENIVYEPVDKDGLIQLIKGGVLLGAEQIAEADGDWMPVSQHPVFDELRRRFAAEAHALLSRISNPREAAEPTAQTPASPAPEVLITNSVIINDDQQPDTSSDAVSDPLLAFAEEPNFAMLSDSEAEIEIEIEADTQAQEQPEDKPLKTSEPEPSQNTADDSLFESLSDTTDEAPQDDTPPVANVSIEKIITQQHDSSLDDDDFQTETPKKSKKGLLVLLLTLIIAGVAAYAFMQSDTTTQQTEKPAPTQQASQQQPAAPVVEPEKTTAPSDETTGETTEQLAEAPPKTVEEPAKENFDNNAFTTWLSGPKEQSQSLNTARNLLEQKFYRHARKIAAYGMAKFDNSADFKKIFEQSIQADKDLHNTDALEPVAIFNINAIRIEDADKGRQIILTRDSADRFIFKPATLEKRDNWRAEIAAYRLCEMILCSFDIPHTAPAKISREDWERIAPNSELTEKLYWESTTVDGQETQFVHGALQELVPQTTPWPIEITGLWREWLGTAPTFNAISEDFVTAHERIKNFGDGTMYQSVIDQQNNITTRQLAEQVSTLILFDFLTNNWERFSGNSALYGLGTPFANGKIISYNNGQSFQSRASRRVLGRFEWTGRFSSSTVAAVRALTPELANSILFAQPSAIERARLDVFWNQHRQALSRIDASIERHGTELVFPFD